MSQGLSIFVILEIEEESLMGNFFSFILKCSYFLARSCVYFSFPLNYCSNLIGLIQCFASITVCARIFHLSSNVYKYKLDHSWIRLFQMGELSFNLTYLFTSFFLPR